MTIFLRDRISYKNSANDKHFNVVILEKVILIIEYKLGFKTKRPF